MRTLRTVIALIMVFVTLFVTGCSKSESLSKDETTKAPTKTPNQITDNPKEVTPVSTNPEDTILERVKELPKFTVTSTTLREDGKWLSVIANVEGGKNKSPQLSWKPVDKASCYAVYMIDTYAQNWLHWMVKDLKVTDLALGEKIENSQYIGPYPPQGTHTYVITVYALAAKPDSYSGAFDSPNLKIKKILNNLDTANGKPGNIIAQGILSGTYTYNEIVK